jgi:hypothetical protein
MKLCTKRYENFCWHEARKMDRPVPSNLTKNSQT